MITYVINTSENKTFDSDRLFDVADYNKIRWMNCRLDKIRECAEEIYIRQDVLGVDDFRIAVIVDFFGYDRIRIPYGRNGYGEEKGVDLSLYMPYIETYIDDHLIGNLEKREMFASDYEIYYVQNSKYERFEFLANAQEQLSTILEGVGDEDVKKIHEKGEDSSDGASQKNEDIAVDENEEDVFVEDKEDEKDDKDKKSAKDEKSADGSSEKDETLPTYEAFKLYCTKSVSLVFKLTDYPYDAAGRNLTFSEFFRAFHLRASAPTKLRRHYYITNYGNGPVRAAFDTLSLSLYIIRMYEREESMLDEGDMEIPSMDADALREVLTTSWMRITVAREQAAENHAEYYSLHQNRNEIKDNIAALENTDEEKAIFQELANLNEKDICGEKTVDTLYHAIVKYDEKTDEGITAENKEEFDQLFAAYLHKRDETNEKSVEAEFNKLRKMGALAMTDQCPSNEQYVHAVNEKHQSISDLFKRALGAEYIEVDYSKERQAAEEAYKEYNKWRACIHKNIIGDIIFLIVAVMIMIIPYKRLQIGVPAYVSLGNHTLVLVTTAVFGVLFAIAFVLNLIIPMWRMRKERKKIIDNYMMCLAKRRYSFSSIRRRYEKDLIRIEEARYEVRQITHIHHANLAKERRITAYRVLLEELHDKVSSMLNNLGVEPRYDPEVVGTEYYDVNKLLRTKDKQIYQIFSVEIIEQLFPRKRGKNL